MSPDTARVLKYRRHSARQYRNCGISFGSSALLLYGIDTCLLLTDLCTIQTMYAEIVYSDTGLCFNRDVKGRYIKGESR